MIAYTSEDYTLDECHRQQAELVATGKYSSVTIRPARRQGSTKLGRVYIQRKDPIPALQSALEEISSKSPADSKEFYACSCGDIAHEALRTLATGS